MKSWSKHSLVLRTVMLFAMMGWLAAAACGAVDARAVSPAALPLLDPSSLQYLGSFIVPNQDGQGNSLAYGGYALGYDALQHGLFFGCHDFDQTLAEVGIPSITDPPQTAVILQDCADVTEGRLPLVDDYMPKLGGTLLYNGRLIVSAYGFYDADNSQVLSHFASTPDLSQAGDVGGPYQVGSQAGMAAGYMTMIPEEWRSSFGGPALTGQCCINIISRSSAGPAASVFDPDDVGGVDPVPAQMVLGYPLEHPLAPVESQNDYFNLATRMGGVAFPSGTRSVLFLGMQGTGPFCYGTGEECGDPVDPYHGTHAYPYVHQVWAYDALELLAVRNGEKQPWEVQPYGIWRLPEMDSTGSARITGATYDPEGGRLYVTEEYGEEPRVHVYQVDLGGSSIFADVPSTHWAAAWIERLYLNGLTGGCATSPSLLYCPTGNVTRAQMAVFLERGMHGLAFTPPDVASTFNDTSGHWAEDWIEALKNDGVTGGCGNGNFCPNEPVTRAEMAVFLLTAENGAGYLPPDATGGVFNDVPSDHWAAAWIEQLFAEGITGGCGGGRFCPEDAVIRAQMAVFLVATFNLP